MKGRLGFARESDPDAFDEALKLVKTVDGLSPAPWVLERPINRLAPRRRVAAGWRPE
jgi:hypothetical protein